MLVITIPGVLFDPLREGAYAVSRDVAEAIDHGEELCVCRARLAGVCRLLDVIGWTCEDPAADTEVDFGVHAGTLRVAVEIMLPLLRDADGERERYEALRGFAATELPGSRQRLTLPAEVVVLLRGVLHVEVVRASEDLSEACSLASPGDWLGPLGRLDGVRGLLDEIGWSAPERQQPVEIDLGMHGPLLQDIIENDLETQRYLADTHDAAQRERAAATAARAEWILAHLQGAS
jgi:hypothetical protein